MWGANSILGALALVGCAAQSAAPSMPKPQGAKKIKFAAADGGSVFGDFYASDKPQSTRVVLMFHQAGSNAAEYYPIAPRVAALGFDCLAVDQRSGGDMWGVANRTAALYRNQPSYVDAYNDILGALTWAHDQHYKTIIAWGSSYSASLVLRLAAEHPDLSGVIAFSPGEYFDQPGLVLGWVKQIKVPMLLASTESEASNSVRAFYNTSRRSGDLLVVSPKGIHGSSTLRPDKEPNGSAFYWQNVESFLKRFEK